jgi:2-iminobutanoate/2-iminopropanoate deaminase
MKHGARGYREKEVSKWTPKNETRQDEKTESPTEQREENMSTIRTEHAPQPIGPYVQGVEAAGFVFVSGQTGLTPSGQLVEGGIEGQTHQVLENLKAILESAGSSLDKVVKVNAYLVDMVEFPTFNRVYEEYFDEPYPARATIGVLALPAGGRVEVDCIALAA